MLPSSKSSLVRAGHDPKTATWIMMGCFFAGFAGIQIVSRVLHKFIPSHTVDCEHTHEDEESNLKEAQNSHDHGTVSTASPQTRPQRQRSRTKSSLPGHVPQPPILPKRKRTSYFNDNSSAAGELVPTTEADARTPVMEENTAAAVKRPVRPSFTQRLTTRLSKMTVGVKEHCDSDGPCKGFTDVCGSECFKSVNGPKTSKANGTARSTLKHSRSNQMLLSESTPLLQATDGDSTSRPAQSQGESHEDDRNHAHPTGDANHAHHKHSHDEDEHQEGRHHHHVPTNAFLSIGLQTSIAIALHKLPEGFITYATNHANPQLGFAVFLALFIHNITEGFAMALPLYLAIGSRIKAMLWSFVLGGLSQPLGAGVAALWFKVAGNGDWAPGEGVYGGMFAVTSGIMVSVALQLFSESLELTHNRTLCMIGAIAGMCILGISSALTAS